MVIVGNGSLGHLNNEFYINNRTGEFLVELQKSNVHIIYCEMLGSSFSPDNNLQNFNLTTSGIVVKYINGETNFKKLISLLVFILKNRKTKLLHVFLPGSLSIAAALFAIFFKIPYSIYLRGEIRRNYLIQKLLISKSEFTLTVSDHFCNQFRSIQSNIYQIKPMIDIEIGEFHERNFDFKDNNQIKLLFVGRIENSKGILEIIKFCEELDLVNFQYSFSVVGGGPLLNELKESQKKGIISKNINFAGLISSKDKLKEYYLNSDVFIFPSHHEGFPRVLYEAMNYSLPILTTFVGGIPSLMRNEINCLRIEVKNVNSIFKQFMRLFDNSKLAYRLSKNSYSTIQEFMNLDLSKHEEHLINYCQDGL